jgi:hypothetical protein
MKAFIISNKIKPLYTAAALLVVSIVSTFTVISLNNPIEVSEVVDSEITIPEDLYYRTPFETEDYTFPDEFKNLYNNQKPEGTTEAINTDELGMLQHQVPPEPIETGLNAVYINTNSGKSITSKTTYVNGNIYISSSDGVLFDFDKTDMRIRGRGNSTWEASKKPYRIKFDKKVSLLGLPKSKDYVLLANTYDKSHIRNSVAFAASKTLSFDVVPQAVHVDLYVNGKYMGLYTIGNSASIAVNVTRDKESTDTGFLLEMGGRNGITDVDYIFTSSIIRNVKIRTPGENSVTSAQISYIKDYCAKADKSVINLADYENYFDMQSIIDYFLLTELLFNYDGSFARSTFLAKEPGGKLKIPSVWDYDLAMGNFYGDRGRYNVWACVHNNETYQTTSPTYINYLIKDPVFQYAVRKRWEQIGNKMYRAALNEINRNRNFLGKAVQKNNTVWAYRSRGNEPWTITGISSWSGHLNYIENFLSLRKKWMDEKIAKFPAKPPGGRDILPNTVITTPETTISTSVATPASTSRIKVSASTVKTTTSKRRNTTTPKKITTTPLLRTTTPPTTTAALYNKTNTSPPITVNSANTLEPPEINNYYD